MAKKKLSTRQAKALERIEKKEAKAIAAQKAHDDLMLEYLKGSPLAKKLNLARFYNPNSILGNDWAIFYCIIGGRMTGKSYALTEFLCKQKKKYGDQVKNYWMRISETSTKAMLANKAAKLIDPDLVRKYDLELSTKGMTVFNRGKTFMEVIPLSQFAKLKGVGFYDKDFKGYYNIVLDEFQLEQGERRTSFDILYNFIGMCENLVRTTKKKVRVFLVGNTLEEASTILKAFNFLPEKFGRFKLKSKRCIIDNLEPTEEYLDDRKGSIADILGGDSMSNYTNKLRKDVSLLYKGRCHKPSGIVKFSKDQGDWFTIWDGTVIKKWNKESMPQQSDFAMLPYLNTFYNKERAQAIIDMYNARAFKFDTLITQSYFTDNMKKIKTK